MVKIGSLFLVAIASAVLGLTTDAQSQQADMSFFVSSVSPGKGADLGGIAEVLREDEVEVPFDS